MTVMSFKLRVSFAALRTDGDLAGAEGQPSELVDDWLVPGISTNGHTSVWPYARRGKATPDNGPPCCSTCDPQSIRLKACEDRAGGRRSSGTYIH